MDIFNISYSDTHSFTTGLWSLNQQNILKRSQIRYIYNEKVSSSFTAITINYLRNKIMNYPILLARLRTKLNEAADFK